MVILHVIAPGEAGGLEGVVEMLAAGHRALGHDVHVAAIVEPGREPHTLAVLRQVGARVHTIALAPRAYQAERSSIAALCERLAPDVVHTHGYRPDVVDAPVARRLGLPTVTTVHGFTGGGLMNRVYEALQRASFRQFQLVIAVALPQVDRLVRAGVALERIRLVPNAWSRRVPPLGRSVARQILGVHDEEFHIGWVGRLSPEKDPTTFIRALGTSLQGATVASVIGDGPERARLEALSARMGLGESVRFRGLLPEAVRLFPAFDAFVLSSRTEGTPLVIFEAMAAGVPIVATAVGGVPNVLGEGRALLVPPADPEALGDAIRRIRDQPVATAERVHEARIRLGDFAAAPWLARYEEIYASVRRAGAAAPHPA